MVNLRVLFASTLIVGGIAMSGVAFAQTPATPAAPTAAAPKADASKTPAPTVKVVRKAKADAPVAKKAKATKVAIKIRAKKVVRVANRTTAVAHAMHPHHTGHHKLDAKFAALHSHFEGKMKWLHQRMKDCDW